MHFLSAAAGDPVNKRRTLRENVSHDKIFHRDLPWECAISPTQLAGWTARGQNARGFRNPNLFKELEGTTYVYEIAVGGTGVGRMCVYVGCSDDPKVPRYLEYLCDGSHLRAPIDAVLVQKLTIWMRRVPRKDPRKAEDELLKKYDYAWNQKGQDRDHRRVLEVKQKDGKNFVL